MMYNEPSPQKYIAGENMNIIDELKALPFTVNVEKDKDGIYVETEEFSSAYSEEATLEESLQALAKNMKSWGRAVGDDIDRWRKGRENELPYLLKILVSSEEELLACLKSSRLVNI